MGLAAAATRSANDADSERGHETRPTTGPDEPYAARSSSPSATTASEQTAITIAFRGPTFMKVCAPPEGETSTAVISSSAAEPFRFGPTRNSPSGTVRTPRAQE